MKLTLKDAVRKYRAAKAAVDDTQGSYLAAQRDEESLSLDDPRWDNAESRVYAAYGRMTTARQACAEARDAVLDAALAEVPS
jgi:hypothetical protein